MSSVDSRLATIERSATLLKLAMHNAERAEADLFISDEEFLAAVSNLVDDIAHEAWWLRCALKDGKALELPALTDDEQSREQKRKIAANTKTKKGGAR
jgi:hypothetical protein